MLAAFSTSTPAPSTAADQLYTLIFDTDKPKRVSRMTAHGDPKYVDIQDYGFTRADLSDHLAGRETYAATLALLGQARAGCKDYDSADEAQILAALDKATELGLSACAFILTDPTGGHVGGHLWLFYDAPYAAADIRATLRKIPRTGAGEDYPIGNPIRLPFGYHKGKRTRGSLVLQDGRRFKLDTPGGLADGIRAVLSLPRNGKPEAAPAGVSCEGASWGEAYKPEHWADLPDGEGLWKSARVASAAKPAHRFALAALLRSERAVIIKSDGTPDDSDSAQVAALVCNLMHAQLPESEIRAIALYLKPQLRPGRTLDHYKAHVDAELVRYRPRNYNPSPTLYVPTVQATAPAPLPEAKHKPEPKSRATKRRPQKVAGALGYLEWLQTQVDPQTGGVPYSQAQCADRLGCSVRTIKRYEKSEALAGKIERRVFAQRQVGCLFFMAQDVVTTSADDVVIADAEIAQQSAENTENAEPAPMQEEHSRPLVPTPAAPPASVPEVVAASIAARTAEKQNPKTGAIYRGRALFRLVLADVRQVWPDADEMRVRVCYERTMKPIRRQMKQESQALAVLGYADGVLYDRLKKANNALLAAARPKPVQGEREEPEAYTVRLERWQKCRRLEWVHRQEYDRIVGELERRGLPVHLTSKRQRTRKESPSANASAARVASGGLMRRECSPLRR
jgi:hypothetical protein